MHFFYLFLDVFEIRSCFQFWWIFCPDSLWYNVTSGTNDISDKELDISGIKGSGKVLFTPPPQRCFYTFTPPPPPRKLQKGIYQHLHIIRKSTPNLVFNSSALWYWDCLFIHEKGNIFNRHEKSVKIRKLNSNFT